ncbi:hypothetical protein KRP22_015134 [Phytophthora ramorum]|nr:hypothetical protein KRP22_15067 [Phytophthora ramorum]
MLLLDHENVDQLPVFSFLVRFGDRLLHHNFVCALLNDLFGIQARGGCQCAGPFGAGLLDLSREHITALGYAVAAKDKVLKPGVARTSFPYFADEEEVAYIQEAVNFVADHGLKFLTHYEYVPHNGAWRHVSHSTGSFAAKKFLTSSVCAGPSHSIAPHGRENLEQAAVLTNACIERLRRPRSSLRDEKLALTEKIEGPCQPQRYLDGSPHQVWEGVPSLGKMKRSLMARFVLKVFIQDELEAMKDKRSDVEKSVVKDEEAMCVVFGGAEKCQ